MWEGCEIGDFAGKVRVELPISKRALGKLRDKPVMIYDPIADESEVVGVIEEARDFNDPKLRMCRLQLALNRKGLNAYRSLKAGEQVAYQLDPATQEFLCLIIPRKIHLPVPRPGETQPRVLVPN